MSNLQDIEVRVKNILKNSLKLKSAIEEINIDEELKNFSVNSLNFVKMLIAVEKEFGFKFSDELLDVSRYKTLRDLVTLIESRVV